MAGSASSAAALPSTVKLIFSVMGPPGDGGMLRHLTPIRRGGDCACAVHSRSRAGYGAVMDEPQRRRGAENIKSTRFLCAFSASLRLCGSQTLWAGLFTVARPLVERRKKIAGDLLRHPVHQPRTHLRQLAADGGLGAVGELGG